MIYVVSHIANYQHVSIAFAIIIRVLYVLLGISHIPHPAFEDGPDRGFRNVGKTQRRRGNTQKNIYNIQNTAKV
jgi:hypothetical protein